MSARQPSGRFSFRSVAYFAPLLVLWVSALALAVIATPLGLASEQDAVTEAAPTAVRIGFTEETAQLAVTAEVSFSSARQLFARAGGTVTQVGLAPQMPITLGQQMLSVDNIQIRAHIAESPIASDVAADSSGPDVAKVGELFSALGYMPSSNVGTKYSNGLRRAINRWNAEALLPLDGVFRVSTVIFVPKGGTTLESVTVQSGEPIEAGAVFGELTPEPISVNFLPPTDAVAELSSLTDQDLVFGVGDESFALTGLSLAAGEISPFADFLASKAAAGTLQKQESEVATSFVGGTLSQSKPTRLATVPNAAVIIGTSGLPCVFSLPSPEAPVSKASLIQVAEARPLSASIGTTSIPARYAGLYVVADVSLIANELARQCE